jgi:uncharacterized protein YegP (UPF0339 family)
MHKDGTEVYQDKAGEWRWRYRRKGRITAEGGEGYSTESNARRAVRRLGLTLAVSTIKKVQPRHLNGDH